MNLSIYFGEKEYEQLKQAAALAEMTPGKYIHTLIRRELTHPTAISCPTPEPLSEDDIVQRRFKLPHTDSERLDRLAAQSGTTPGLYLRRLISHAGQNEYYIYTEDLTALMETYTRMSDAIIRQTKLLLRSNALPQDGKLLQEQLQNLNKQVLSIYDDIVRTRKKTIKKIQEEQCNADN